MRRFWQRLGDSSGSVLILVAGIIFFVAAFTVLAVDISKLLVTRAQLQNSADAGALAGAEMFMQSPVPDKAVIEARARDLANANRSYVNSSTPMDQVTDITATAYTNAENQNTYGIVKCVTRSVVSQYFTALPGATGKTSEAANLNRFGNVAAVAAARAGSVCQVTCVKPWAIPDRWNDNTWPAAKGWNNNGVWDREKFTDTNKNGYHDAGEPSIDGSSAWTKNGAGPTDGQYNEEFYNPITTGYVAWKDLGTELTLKAGTPGAAQAPSQYFPIRLPGSIGGKDYDWNIANCNQHPVGPGDTLQTEQGNKSGPTGHGMRDLIDKDPGAYWDDGCQCVKSQFGDDSPRIVFIPMYDPRIPVNSGLQTIRISKIAAFFIESATVDGTVKGRFVRVQTPNGAICPPGANSGQFVFTISLIDPALANQ